MPVTGMYGYAARLLFGEDEEPKGEAALLASHLITEGKAIVDCGCTQTIGGVEAIEACIELRRARRPDLKIRWIQRRGHGSLLGTDSGARSSAG